MTRYFVRYIPKNTGRENFTAFDSMLARAYWMIAHALLIDIVKTWEA